MAGKQQSARDVSSDAGRAAELMAQAAIERRRAVALEAQVAEIKARLEGIIESPGWRLVARYRNWLRITRIRHPRLSRWSDRLAVRLLRGLAPAGRNSSRPLADARGSATGLLPAAST